MSKPAGDMLFTYVCCYRRAPPSSRPEKESPELCPRSVSPGQGNAASVSDPPSANAGVVATEMSDIDRILMLGGMYPLKQTNLLRDVSTTFRRRASAAENPLHPDMLKRVEKL